MHISHTLSWGDFWTRVLSIALPTPPVLVSNQRNRAITPSPCSGIHILPRNDNDHSFHSTKFCSMTKMDQRMQYVSMEPIKHSGLVDAPFGFISEYEAFARRTQNMILNRIAEEVIHHQTRHSTPVRVHTPVKRAPWAQIEPCIIVYVFCIYLIKKREFHRKTTSPRLLNLWVAR
jgi:hypothetical protein